MAHTKVIGNRVGKRALGDNIDEKDLGFGVVLQVLTHLSVSIRRNGASVAVFENHGSGLTLDAFELALVEHRQLRHRLTILF